MKKLRSNEHALGIMVTSRALHAVLLEEQEEGPVVLRTFTRQRTTRMGAASQAHPVHAQDNALPDSSEATDFTIQFGSGPSSASSDLFLASEFGTLDAGSEEEAELRLQASTFVLELGDVLAECRDAGYENPVVAFCVGSSEVAHTELRVLDLAKKKKAAKGTAAKEKAPKEDPAAEPKEEASTGRISKADLMALLREQVDRPLKDECVSFLPMMPSDDGFPRYLAVYPKATEPVAATLTEMRSEKGRRLPAVRLLDAEVSLYIGMTRLVLAGRAEPAPSTPPNVLVVRAGLEDTLVLFLKGDVPQHVESLRSLTAYDSPETICSRVLLLQDEYGAGEVQQVLLLSEDKEKGLIDSFEMFFPDAQVASLWNYMPPLAGGEAPASGARGLVAAVGAAYRLLDDERYEAAFDDVNLLPAKLLRKPFKLPVTWHVIAMGILIFCTVFFFVGQYFRNAQEINEYRDKLRVYPPELADANVQELQARIDSMQMAYAGHVRALQMLDSLLVGSDMWSTKLNDIIHQAAAVRGVWVARWEPANNWLNLQGNATSRDRVVQFAERVEGEISTLTFSEIRDWPVYSFRMRVPLQPTLPAVTRYLREQATMQNIVSSEPDADPDAPMAAAEDTD